MLRAPLLLPFAVLLLLPTRSQGLLIDDFSMPAHQVQSGAGSNAVVVPGAWTGSRVLQSIPDEFHPELYDGPTLEAGAGVGGVLRYAPGTPGGGSSAVIAWDALVGYGLGQPLVSLDLTAFPSSARLAFDVVGVSDEAWTGPYVDVWLSMVWYDYFGNASGNGGVHYITQVPQTVSWGIFAIYPTNLELIRRIEIQIGGGSFPTSNRFGYELLLDNFRIIPEPSTAVLVGAGLASLVGRRRP